MTIVYQSNTGFTETYARMLAQDTGFPLYSAEQARKALSQGSEILYLGWVCAGHISGLDQAVKRYDVKGACAVGLMPPDRSVFEHLARSNYLPSGPMYYLQGGYAPERLKGIKKPMLNMVLRSLKKKLSGQANPPEEEIQLLAMICNGGSAVCEENLVPVLRWLNDDA